MLNTESAAQILYQRRVQKIGGPRLAFEQRPTTLATALSIQTRVTELLVETAGESVGAWKCLLPTSDKIILGPIYSSTITQQLPCSQLAFHDSAAIEPEIAFVFGKSLPNRPKPYSETEIRDAIKEIRMGFELLFSRYSNTDECTFPEMLADGLVNQGLFLGPIINAHPTELDILLFDGETERSIKGTHPNLDPIAPVFWLVNYLRQHGTGIQAGQAVITGSFAGVFKLPFNKKISLEYKGLGKTDLLFTKIETC